MIPKIFFQTSKNKPEPYIIDKIVSKCPQWKYIHFNDEEAVQFFRENYLEEFKDIIEKFNNVPVGAHKSDLFRYYFLYINGGVFMDSDAMIEMNIEKIIKDYSFFSVRSSYVPNSIFQGFIGSTPKNSIIYKALCHAYCINIQELTENYHILCYQLYNIIKNGESNHGIYLYDERYRNEDSAECFNHNNEIILIHYWKHKIIPTL